MTLRIILPWPPKTLSPNTRHAHWSQLAKAKKDYRAACAEQAIAQGAAARMFPGKCTVTMVFVQPDRRARDLDNLIAAMKSGLDGLADALKANDRDWALAAIIDHTRIGGFVEITVQEAASSA
jgi:crossover junction endodeoxyribonuclease RusA